MSDDATRDDAKRDDLADKARPTPRDRQRAWQSHIDCAIDEAAARGAFDDLPGKGKPLVWETEGDDEMWLAHHLLKGQGFQPAWIERLKGIDAEAAAIAARVDAFAADWTGPGAPGRRDARDAALARLEAELTDRIAALNRAVDAHNLDVAAAAAPRRRLAAAEVLAALRARLDGTM